MSKQPVKPQHPAGLMDSIQSEVAGEASPLLEFLVEHAKVIIACVLVCIIGIAGYGTYVHFSGTSDREAQDELGRIVIIPDHQKRMAALETFLAKAPASTKDMALYTLAQTASVAGDPQEAYKTWSEVAKTNKDLRVTAAYGMAGALAQQGKLSEALAVYEGILDGLGKNDALPVNSQIAFLAEAEGNSKRALTACEAILAIPNLDQAEARIWTQKADALRQQTAQPK